ncbi:MAG: M48 family metallopeptidase [Elusimicrobia bacterium]|nr:M48 family metallopeptidase [Elusimicrobiota bacterium]
MRDQGNKNLFPSLIPLFPYFFIPLFIAFGGCSRQPNAKPRIWLPEDAEILAGGLTTKSLVELFPLHEDARWQDYAGRMGKRIVQISERPNYQYRFLVVQSSQPNAFASPDGTIFLTTGLLKLCDGKENEIAAVMAHEIGHVARRHGALLLQEQLGWSALLFLAFGFDRPVLRGAGGFGKTLLALGYSREMEIEADEAALHYLKKLEIPESSLSDFLKKVISQEQTLGLPFENYLSSHPPVKDRLEKLTK